MAEGPTTDTVQEFLRANVVPERRAEPRLAEPLRGLHRHDVPSPQGRVAAWRLGDGPALLLVHGFADDNSLWAPLIDALVDRRRALVVLDLPGHGFSEGEWGLAPQAADGILAVEAALGPVDALVAHSAGTGGALIAISEGIAVDRAVFIAPPPLGSSSSRWSRYAERLGVSDEIARAARSLYEERVGPARASFDGKSHMAGLDAQLLFVHSRDDERFPIGDSEAMVRLCRRAELLAVDGLSHRRTARDLEVVARIADFVASP